MKSASPPRIVGIEAARAGPRAADHNRIEEPTMAKVRSWVGLDVHARSVLAVTFDGESGELRSRRQSATTSEVVEFCCSPPRPTRVAYEARPTGCRPAPSTADGSARRHAPIRPRTDNPPGGRGPKRASRTGRPCADAGPDGGNVGQEHLNPTVGTRSVFGGCPPLRASAGRRREARA